MDFHSSSRVTQSPTQKRLADGIWRKVVNTLIRPPKNGYPKSILGPEHFHFQDRQYRRLDINVTHEDQTIEMSILEPQLSTKNVILYLHGNSSSRIQAFSLIQFLPQGYSLACFDFIGCGNSQGQYISLGVRESEQIKSIVKYLQTNSYDVILWGRSMGAVSCLKYGGTNIIVADSPFQSLKGVCKETINSKKPDYVPRCMVSCLFPCVYAALRRDIKNTAKFDIDELNILKSVKALDSSKTLIFLSGLEDTLINHSHSQKLHDSFQGQHKKLFLFPGTHNAKRPNDIICQVFSYIQQRVSSHRAHIGTMMGNQQIQLVGVAEPQRLTEDNVLQS